MTRIALEGRGVRAERARRTYAGRAAAPFYWMAELRMSSGHRPGFLPESSEKPEAFVKKDETKPYKNVTFVLDGRRDLCYHMYLSPQE